MICGMKDTHKIIIKQIEEIKLRIVRFSARGKVKWGILEGNIILTLRSNPFARQISAGLAGDILIQVVVK